MTENEIHVEAFVADAFTETVKQAGGGMVSRQVEYLAAYLDALKVATVVRETRYIDRHYMDEYVLFYSRMLNPPSNTVTRLHFFEKKFDGAALNRWMREAMRGRDLTKTIAKEAGRYQGYCCVRPIPNHRSGAP